MTGAVCLKTFPPRSSTKWLWVATNGDGEGSEGLIYRDLMIFPKSSTAFSVGPLGKVLSAFKLRSIAPENFHQLAISNQLYLMVIGKYHLSLTA
jgi:hypothetical protein